MKYFFFILGCQMNTADAERISTILDSFGFKKTSQEKEADLIITLACSVRQKAVDRIYGKINKWQKEKKKRKLVTALTGCVLPHDKKIFKEKFDLVFEIEEMNKLPILLRRFFSLKKKKIETPSDYLEISPTPLSSFIGSVPIMTGCDNFCTYCAVPYTRGRERSRPQKKIIKEIKILIKKGIKDIVLLGQNVNSYGHIKGKKYQNNKPFINLLKSINKISGHFWIHFISNHPKDITPGLIKIIPKLNKISPWLHFPLQSGNNEILKKMNRPYTREKYLKIVKLMKKTIPDLALTTDIIVGFPGETKKQFQDTLEIAKKVKYDMIFSAQYSPRPGTPAAKMKDSVSKLEKERREKELTEILAKTTLENNKKLINFVQEVLVDGQKGDYYYGRTKTWKVVKFKDKKNNIGRFVNLEITKAEPWKLEGKIK